MRKFLVLASLILLIGCALNGQQLKKVQISMKTGMTLKGNKGVLSNESITFTSNGEQKTIALSDINMVQYKEGKAGKWAGAMGGGCFALGLITSITQAGKENSITGETSDFGTLMAGTLIWTGVFAGVGAVIGAAVDHWQIAYNGRTGFKPQNFNINIGPSKYAKLNLGVTYRF